MSSQGLVQGSTQVNYGLFTNYGVIYSDNTAVFQNVISGVTLSISAATTIKIEVSYQWNCERTTDNIEVQLLFDGVSVPSTLGFLQVEEATDNTGNFMGTGSGQQLPVGRVYYLTTGAAGTHTVDLEFRVDNAGFDCSTWDISVSVDGV